MMLAEAEVTVPCLLGLHLRTAARLISLTRRFRASIRLRRGRTAVDGKSVLGVLRLGASRNTKLQVEAHGEDAEAAVAAIRAFFDGTQQCADEPLAREPAR